MYYYLLCHNGTYIRSRYFELIQSKMTALHLGVSKQQTDTVKEIVSKADPSAINAVDDVSITMSYYDFINVTFYF